MISTGKAPRFSTASCAAVIIAMITATYPLIGVQAKDPAEPKPPPKKFESLLKGDKPDPKPTPKTELYLVETSGGAFLMNRSQVEAAGKEPPDCKIKCLQLTTLDGKRLAIPEAALSSFKLSPKVGGYIKENAKRFGPDTAKWSPPVSPEAAKVIQAGATVQLVLPMF